MAEPVIACRGLSRWYGNVIGLNDLTVDVGPGVTGLLGPNGAGKTTFLDLVTGQIRPSQGEVRVLGERPWGNPGLRRDLGYCPEPDAFHRFMSGREFVTRLGRLQGLGATEAGERASEVLETLGLSDAMDRPIDGYSKGMRQRTKLAQALVADPELLLLDEPLVGMDPVGRRLVIDLIRERGESGRHVLVASHVLHEIQAMTSQVLLVHRGRLRAVGVVDELRELLEDHPHAVRLTCPDPRRLGRVLVDRPEVERLAFPGEGVLRVRVRSPRAFFADLPGILLDEGIVPEDVSVEDEGLGAVFRYLIGGGGPS